ncbi:MAG: tetratricopeptide repeat protein [Granulicella sp.]
MATNTEEEAGLKRRLILRDTVTFLVLSAIILVLFFVTLFLFRSFETHRRDLAKRWADRGLVAFRAHQPEQAIADYRTALSYTPGERSYELLLAEALGQAGRTEEAYNYFTGLWETRPGDGFINLQLARLSVTKHDMPGAVNFYHGSIFGNWQGDGVERRRAVRLELAQYLIEQHQLNSAKAELLIAGGNAPNIPALDITLGGLLEQTGDPQDALGFYQKALVKEPRNQTALSRAGQLAYTLGDYAQARRLLGRATREQPQNEQDAALLSQAERIQQLSLADTLSARERVDRILTARAIVKRRLTDCTAASPDNTLQPLTSRWTGEAATTSRMALLHDSDKQAAAVQLLYDTEIETSEQCAAPTGDDALLLLLAHAAAQEEARHR